MKVYTKTGDKGTTSLVGGSRVSKGHIRLEAYGSVDELISFIGLLRDQEFEESYKQQLITIQSDLMTCSSHLASDSKELVAQLPIIDNEDVKAIESYIDDIDNQLPPLKSFILPGGHTTVSYCHVARTVCRRAERIIINMSADYEVNPLILKYVNRLSDYLFVLGRKLSIDLDVNEITWKP